MTLYMTFAIDLYEWDFYFEIRFTSSRSTEKNMTFMTLNNPDDDINTCMLLNNWLT